MSKIMHSIGDEIRETYKFRWVVHSFINSTLKMRYRRSFLGFAWSFLGPMFNYLAMGIVMSKIARFSSHDFLAHMLIGSCIFNFINTGFSIGGNSLIANEQYIRKIYLPKLVFPLSAIGMEAVNFFLSIFSLIVILLFIGHIDIKFGFFWLPIGFTIISFFTLGVAMILSVLFVFFRDLNHILPVIMQIAFFSTPIIYPETAIPPEYLPYLKYNPFFHIVEFARRPLVTGVLPGSSSIFFVLILTVFVFLCGLWVIKQFDNKVIFKL
jgi:ABC-type polysaccharide/polyol phosphate export permease